jgi:hypothetical protein
MRDDGSVKPPDSSDGSGSLSFAQSRSLKRELLDELRAGWERGTPGPVEGFLRRWPGDRAADPDVASLLFEDYCQRRARAGADASGADLSEYEERFPAQKDALHRLIREQDLLQSLGGADPGRGVCPLALPGVGDELFGFRLRAELGRGAFARVFRAEQAELAGRPVVLKVSAREGDEPQTLAQLQHTHIVPLYSVHEDGRAGLRAVCMPYFGGASLSAVLKALWAQTPCPTSGRQLALALLQASGGRQPPDSLRQPPD